VSSVGSFFSYVNDARAHEPEMRILINEKNLVFILKLFIIHFVLNHASGESGSLSCVTTRVHLNDGESSYSIPGTGRNTLRQRV